MKEITTLGAEVKRIDALFTAVAPSDDARLYQTMSESQGNEYMELIDTSKMISSRFERSIGSGLTLEDVRFGVPSTTPRPDLLTEVAFALQPGDSLLIAGASGCGKSSLLRVIAGLWGNGSGKIIRPPDNVTMFLPQTPYMPLGSFRVQLEYPKLDNYTDQKLEDSLNAVGLDLADLGLTLESHANWKEVLSNGEQQV